MFSSVALCFTSEDLEGKMWLKIVTTEFATDLYRWLLYASV